MNNEFVMHFDSEFVSCVKITVISYVYYWSIYYDN